MHIINITSLRDLLFNLFLYTFVWPIVNPGDCNFLPKYLGYIIFKYTIFQIGKRVKIGLIYINSIIKFKTKI